ncbi:hypothetical protein OEZ86_011217 [Tetradesmus obliquus]|nr:hypothetical protein OEZ86_011217 [Tetradesmus obliquus]
MAFRAIALLFAAVFVVCATSAAAQATPNHRGKSPKGTGCGFRHIELSLPFTPIAADRIFPATPAIKDAPIATSIVRSFYLRPEGNPDGSNIAIATVNAITMQPPTDGNQRVVNAAVNAKFASTADSQYNGWVTGQGVLNYDFAGAAPAVSSDYAITGGSGDFLGAIGTLTSTIVGTQGALVLKLDVPIRQCFNA